MSRANFQRVIKTVEEFFVRSLVPKKAPVDVVSGANNLGVKLVFENLVGRVSGFLIVDGSSQPIIGVNGKQPEVRQRFTIAHELGHLLLHTSRESTASFIDKNFVVFNRDQASESGILVHEIEANFFAAEILMPAEILYRDVIRLNSTVNGGYKLLAKQYGVSEEAMRFRLSNLGFIKL